MPSVSIIIPVFNVECYLARCLDSILAQTFRDFEAIIIDDGSSDRSGEICDKYSLKDSRVKVFHTPNRGVSSARNLALKLAQGTYLAFVDSDDYVEPDMIELLYNAMISQQNIDCVLSSSFVETDDGKLLSILHEGLANNSSATCNAADPQLMFATPAMWNKLYRKSIIAENHIKFNPSVAIGEDLLFYLTYIRYCRYFVCVSQKPLYHYIQRTSSVTKTGHRSKNESVILAFQILQTLYQKNGWYERYQNELEYLAIVHLFISTSVRAIRFGYDMELVKAIDRYTKENFPKYQTNKYIHLLSSHQQIVFSLLSKKLYRIIQILFWIKR